MAIYKVDGRAPQVGAAAFVADNATLAGDVTLAEESSVWYGAVLRADTGCITIGENTNVQDNAVLHTAPGWMSRWARGYLSGTGPSSTAVQWATTA